MDHRKIPIEVLRDFARSQAELTSIRQVADAAGLGRSTMHQFIVAGTMPHLRVRKSLGEWYLRRLAGVDELALIRPYSDSLEVIAGEVPESHRLLVVSVILQVVRRGYEEAGEALPPWLEVAQRRLAAQDWLYNDT